MSRMDSPLHGHDSLSSTSPAALGSGGFLSPSDPAMTGYPAGDSGDGFNHGWESAWIDLGGEG